MLRDRLVVVLINCVYVFNLTQGFTVEQCVKTCDNPRGACAIGTMDDMAVLATLDKQEGTLRVQNDYLNSTSAINAFENGIQHLAINLDVTYL